MIHLARAASGNIPGAYQARCTCGWRGSLITDEDTATGEAIAHELVQTRPQRPLPAYRRLAVPCGDCATWDVHLPECSIHA